MEEKRKKRRRRRNLGAEYLVLVAGKVAPQVKASLLQVIASKGWTESQYVREAVVEKLERDLVSAT